MIQEFGVFQTIAKVGLFLSLNSYSSLNIVIKFYKALGLFLVVLVSPSGFPDRLMAVCQWIKMG